MRGRRYHNQLKKSVMKSPITGKEMTIQRRMEKLTLKKDTFEVVYHYYRDDENGMEFTDKKLDELSTVQLYNAYRAKYHLPFPEEIQAIRAKYALPANQMAGVLGFGVNVYRNYENGEIPSESNARLIQLAKDPHEFRKLLKLSGVYQGKELEEVLERIEKLITERKGSNRRAVENYLIGDGQPNDFNGFRIPNLERFMHMVTFFAEKMQPFKVKMNKLLFYADFLNYKKTGHSISGARYLAIQRGPVPKNYDSLFNETAENGLVDMKCEFFDNGKYNQQFLALEESRFNPELFTDEELKTIREVAQRFHNTNTKDIIELSHLEKGWVENECAKKDISYTYSFELLNV